MFMQFRGQLLSVSQRTSKGGYKYTPLEFNLSSGETFSLSADGHIAVGAEFLRKDLDWVLEIAPKTYQGNTRFTVTRITNGAGDKSKGKE